MTRKIREEMENKLKEMEKREFFYEMASHLTLNQEREYRKMKWEMRKMREALAQSVFLFDKRGSYD